MPKFLRPIRFTVYFRQGNGQTRAVAHNLSASRAWSKVEELNELEHGRAWMLPH